MSRKTAFSGDVSHVNLIVGWNKLVKSTNFVTSAVGVTQWETMSSIIISFITVVYVGYLEGKSHRTLVTLLKDEGI